MDFQITAAEERVLLLIVEHLGAGNAPTPEELAPDAGRDVQTEVEALRAKGWLLVRDVDGRATVIGLSPLATAAVSNRRYGRRE
ncbi:hypothetical protein ACFQ2B_26000 [Streptomyces stramineus]|uniref:Uncharacterized protein n=1 Tax=Streptomyces stramineus TaxID=173861 RepID=A0ABP3JM62_9ACTN